MVRKKYENVFFLHNNDRMIFNTLQAEFNVYSTAFEECSKTGQTGNMNIKKLRNQHWIIIIHFRKNPNLPSLWPTVKGKKSFQGKKYVGTYNPQAIEPSIKIKLYLFIEQ